MRNFQVTLIDDGRGYRMIEVEADGPEEACDKAFAYAKEHGLEATESFEDDGDCQLGWVGYVCDDDTDYPVPREHERLPLGYSTLIESVRLAESMVAKGHAEEAIMALENIPGLKGLGDLVRGVR